MWRLRRPYVVYIRVSKFVFGVNRDPRSLCPHPYLLSTVSVLPFDELERFAQHRGRADAVDRRRRRQPHIRHLQIQKRGNTNFTPKPYVARFLFVALVKLEPYLGFRV